LPANADLGWIRVVGKATLLSGGRHACFTVVEQETKPDAAGDAGLPTPKTP
jgi:hypothetical protein